MTATEAVASAVVNPGHSLGPFHLGASIYEVLTLLKEDRTQYSAIDLHYSSTEPLTTPVVITLPEDGIRLRFDGADQRLRLIEVLDFRKTRLVHKGGELNKAPEGSPTSTGPAFKRIYQIFGASYPGEYLPPDRTPLGTYVLSWPGVAFNFPLLHSVWSPNKDHVSLLSSSAAGPAAQMAIFEGASWPEVRGHLFVQPPNGPRLSALTSRPKDGLPAEIEAAHVVSGGRIQFTRGEPALPFEITINKTHLQDLITELGPPDTQHKRDDRLDSTEPRGGVGGTIIARPSSNGRAFGSSQPSSYSSTGTDTFDADFDSADAEEEATERAQREKFWCYFGHGMDILVGPGTTTQHVVLKVVIHGNVPGSYAFNRHRRLRWTLDLSDGSHSEHDLLSSEDHFDSTLKPALMQRFASVWPESEMSRGKVVNRTWGASPTDSSFFLPDAGEDLVEGTGSEQWLGNTKLYSFPGLIFEVTENDAVSTLTVY